MRFFSQYGDDTLGRNQRLQIAALLAFLLLGGFAGFYGLGTTLIKNLLLETAHQTNQVSAQNFAILAKSEIFSLINKTQIMVRASESRFRTAKEQHLFLKSELEKDQNLIAFAIFRKRLSIERLLKGPSARGEWKDKFRLIRRRDDPARLVRPQFLKLNADYPLNFDQAREGIPQINLGWVQFEEKKVPILRIAFKHGKYVIAAEYFHDEFLQAISQAHSDHTIFVTNQFGRLLAQSHENYFQLGENLAHLPILQAASSTKALQGQLNFSEYPGSQKVLASYQQIPSLDLMVVSQQNRAVALQPLAGFQKKILLLGGILLSIAGLICFGLLSSLRAVAPVIPISRDSPQESDKITETDQKSLNQSGSEKASLSPRPGEESAVEDKTWAA